MHVLGFDPHALHISVMSGSGDEIRCILLCPTVFLPKECFDFYYVVLKFVLYRCLCSLLTQNSEDQ